MAKQILPPMVSSRMDAENQENQHEPRSGSKIFVQITHFVRYGIRPKTFRSYEAGALEQGYLYHRCLQQLASLLSQENIPISDPDSLWQTITRQKCDAAVEGILNKELQGYQEGVFSYSQRDAFHGRQLKENCKEICWNMILHGRQIGRASCRERV